MLYIYIYIYIIQSKQALNQRLVLNKMHRVIKFNQKSFVKTIQRKAKKIDF